MVCSLSIAMRPVCFYILVSVAMSFSAMANIVPVDPDILIDSGGDAVPIDYTGLPITVGPNGGGIFVFHNATGNPLNELDLNLDFPLSPLPPGFVVEGNIPVPPSPVRQMPKFDVSTSSGFDCTGAASATVSCLGLKFILNPGPLIPTDGNFVLDFNNVADYTETDIEVENGTYTGGDIPGGTGGWAPGGTPTTGDVTPSVAPEPSYRATAGFMGLAVLAVWNYRRRLTVKKS